MIQATDLQCPWSGLTVTIEIDEEGEASTWYVEDDEVNLAADQSARIETRRWVRETNWALGRRRANTPEKIEAVLCSSRFGVEHGDLDPLFW